MGEKIRKENCENPEGGDGGFDTLNLYGKKKQKRKHVQNSSITRNR